jgi:hypothetical protein
MTQSGHRRQNFAVLHNAASQPPRCGKLPLVCLAGLSHLHIPEKWCSELEHILHALAKSRRLNPFAPRHVSHFVQRNSLHFIGELLSSSVIGGAHPLVDQPLQLRDVRPPEPGSRTRTRQAKVDGGIDDVRGEPPSVKQIPPPFSGGSLRARAIRFVDQSMSLRMTLKPIDSSR